MIVNGWIDWCTRIDGIGDKVYSAPCRGEWLTCHSVVGEEADFQDGVPNRFFDTRRDTSGRYIDAAAASCKFVLRKSGQLIQMYSLDKATWTSGGPQANIGSHAIEAEGGGYNADGTPNFGEKLTLPQEETFIRLFWELAAHHGWDTERNGALFYLKQHKDVARQFGYGATACASDRYSNAWARIAAGERDGGMSLEERARLARLERIVAGNHLTTEVWDGNVDDLKAVGLSDPIVGTVIGLTGEQALAYADRRGFSLALGVKLARDEAGDAASRLTEYIANTAAGVGGRDIPEHTHEGGKVKR